MKFAWIMMALFFATPTFAADEKISSELLLERSEKGRLVIPSWCDAWYDGCNHCVLAKNKTRGGVCTSRVCEKMEEPYCTRRKGEKK